MGHESSAYIDDIWMVGKTYKETLANVSNTYVLFEKLGFIINYEKSAMVPTTKLEHLGFIIDSAKMTVSLTREKIEKLTVLCTKCIQNKGSLFIYLFSNIYTGYIYTSA